MDIVESTDWSWRPDMALNFPMMQSVKALCMYMRVHTHLLTHACSVLEEREWLGFWFDKDTDLDPGWCACTQLWIMSAWHTKSRPPVHDTCNGQLLLICATFPSKGFMPPPQAGCRIREWALNQGKVPKSDS